MDRRRMINKFVKIYIKPINFIMKRLSYSQRVQFETEIVKSIKNEKSYIRLSILPKRIEEVGINGQTNNSFENVAIILQGPVDTNDNFTYETVKMYAQYYPGARIILSTWNDTDKKVIDQFRSLGNVEVVLNEYPDVNGIGNINYQLKTSLMGVEYAKKLKAKYIWKTRTDQRFYNPFSLNELLNTYQNGRLTFLGGVTNSHYNRLFHISDFMVFGSMESVELYFSCPPDSTDTKTTKYYRLRQDAIPKEIEDYFKITEECEKDLAKTYDFNMSENPMDYANPEMLLSYHYYKCVSAENHSEDWNLKREYDDFLRNYIVIVDADMLCLYWDKYDHQAIQQTYFDRRGKLDHSRWISLKKG